MTSLITVGTLLVAAVVFAVIRQGLAALGYGQPLGLGVKGQSPYRSHNVKQSQTIIGSSAENTR